jgi:hypothetical protein
LCIFYTDGCGSMKPVREIEIQMGLNHMFVPLHTQSLKIIMGQNAIGLKINI